MVLFQRPMISAVIPRFLGDPMDAAYAILGFSPGEAFPKLREKFALLVAGVAPRF